MVGCFSSRAGEEPVISGPGAFGDGEDSVILATKSRLVLGWGLVKTVENSAVSAAINSTLGTSEDSVISASRTLGTSEDSVMQLLAMLGLGPQKLLVPRLNW